MRHLLKTTVPSLCATHVTAQFATFAVVLLCSISLLAMPFATQANTTNSTEISETETPVRFLKDIAPILDKQGVFSRHVPRKIRWTRRVKSLAADA